MIYHRPSVTHIIVETNNENVVQLSYNVMIALLRGIWILNTECKFIYKLINQ